MDAMRVRIELNLPPCRICGGYRDAHRAAKAAATLRGLAFPGDSQSVAGPRHAEPA